MTPQKDLTIIIPAYNEDSAIGDVLESIAHSLCDIVHEIIVVDDGSSDSTPAIAQQAELVRLVHHKRNRGYGAAIKTGIKSATTDYVMTYDADGQHRPDDARLLYEAIKASDSDMVVGARSRLIHSELWRMPGKWLLGRMANYLTRSRVPDLNSGLRVMLRSVVLRYLHLCPAGFSFSTTITIALYMRSYAVEFRPINVRKRVGSSTVKLRTGLDTLILLVRLAALFDPLRIFLPVSILLVFIGFAWGIPYAIAGNGVSVGSMLAVVTGIIAFAIGILTDQVSQLRLERYEDRD